MSRAHHVQLNHKHKLGRVIQITDSPTSSHIFNVLKAQEQKAQKLSCSVSFLTALAMFLPPCPA